MKMAKKLLAVVLTGVMAVSMLTGCATLDARNIASDLEGMLKVVSDKATVSATNDAKKLAEQAAMEYKRYSKITAFIVWAIFIITEIE